MERPCFLIAEPKPPDGLSSRKLVLETGGYNVVTAYSGQEALGALRRFPGVSAVIIHSEVPGMSCDALSAEVRACLPKVKIIVLSPNSTARCSGADEHLDSHEPEVLLSLAQREFGDPRKEEVTG